MIYKSLRSLPYSQALTDFVSCCLRRESSVQAESLMSEVLGELLQDVSSAEIELERKRVAEEKRRLEEARLVLVF